VQYKGKKLTISFCSKKRMMHTENDSNMTRLIDSNIVSLLETMCNL